MAGPHRAARPPTLRDVAQAAGVSIATVSNVLNAESEKFVSPKLTARVRQFVAELDYHPNILARGMRGKGRRALAILVPQFENFFFSRVVIGAERIAYEHGYVLLICSTYDDPARERFYVESLISQQVDGFLLSPTMGGAANTRLLRQRGVPYVVVDRALEGYRGKYPYVGFSNRRGAELATEALIARGHRQIAFIGWETRLPVISGRRAGFAAAVARHGLTASACPILLGAHTRAAGEELTRRLLAEHTVTAILAGHQYQAEGVIRALRAAGRHIPADISLIVFGRPAWTDLVEPPLVCVEMPDCALGELATEQLIDLVNGAGMPFRQTWLSPCLSPGESVGAGPGLLSGAVPCSTVAGERKVD